VLCSGHSDVPGWEQYDGTMRLKLNGEEVGQMAKLGTFSEYVVCPSEQVIKIKKEMPAGTAALIGCSVATGVGAVTRHAKVHAGANVVIIGCGGVGLNIVQGARLAGTNKIIGVDLLDNKLEMARSFGATHTVNASKDNVVEAVQEIVGGPGADFAFDGIGSEATASQVLDVIAPGGHAVLVGIPAVTVRSSFSPFGLVFHEKKLTGSFYGSVRADVDFPILCDLYLDGKLDLDRLVSQTISLDDINQGFEDLKSGSVARSVIDMS
jgi:S-(hydroxymethyl)glutathione dehydrogenase/alcohol dehydrogenase